jgi:Secretory lipase
MLNPASASLTDYEGPKAGFTVGKLSGQGVVDGVRAALNFNKVVPCKEKTQVVFEGFSGGALATGWAVQVQPTYAPELSKYIRGAAFGGLPRNLTRDLIFLDGGVQSGLVVTSIAGESAIFPELNRFLNKHLNDAGRKAIAFARDNCLTPVLAQYPNTSFFETFTDLTRDQALANPVVRNTQAQLLLAAKGSSIPRIPLFIYHGTGDKTVPFQDTVDYYNVQCARGIKSLTRLDVNGTDHTTTDALIQGAQARQFLLARLAGKPAPQGCSKSLYYPPAEAVQAINMRKRATLHEY